MSNMVKGYKVFNPDWTCQDKQYTCPGDFKEEGDLAICEHGIHFCKNLMNCFNYYPFDSKNKVAEIIAIGEIIELGEKCCTDNIKIVRELSWQEVLNIVNIGAKCTGHSNTGNKNTGNWNTGHGNKGDYNTGDYNNGDQNAGSFNSGGYNSGYGNRGSFNSGNYNFGNFNSGNFNFGDSNTGHHNFGNRNFGYWNLCDFSVGCFNTIRQTMSFFNKPSDWTYADWLQSDARKILEKMPSNYSLNYVKFEDMTEEEKVKNSEAAVTGGYFKEIYYTSKDRNRWWRLLSDKDKKEILSIPNFDKEIFKEITGIDVNWKEEKR